MNDARADAIFEGLNDAQRAAVLAVRGPVCILAGAGTGKTTTITRRIAWQVASETFAPGEILAVTFSVKAAREMRARLERLAVRGVRAMTFHAEALAHFRRFSPDHPELLSHKGQVLHQIATRLPMPHRFTAVRDLATEIEWAKNRRVGVDGYLGELERAGHEPPIPAELMARVFAEYERRKSRAGLIDFEDLLERTLALLAEDGPAVAAVRARYRAFTVDEYQDVNVLQQALLDAWLGERDDLCVVGDDYQSIYGFTGASARWLLSFGSRFDGAQVVTLTENHRSTPEVLAIANRLVPRLGGSHKTLRAVRDGGPNPTLRDFDSGADEVRWIVGECRRLHDDGIAWEAMAVLTRINGRSEDIEEAFARERIPYQVRDGSFLNRPAARAVLARLRRAPSGRPIAATIEEIARALGYDPRGKYEGGDEATRQADLERMIALAREFPGDDPATFAADLRARFAPEEDGRGVQIMTYHRAKGLEFEAVFLPRLEDKELPFALAATDEEVAEERRLFYVGITRAKRWLFLSYARSREGERRSKPKPSRFLAEIAPRSAPARAARAPGQAAGRTAVPAPADDPVFDSLRAWRKEVAARMGVPAYVVFHDATLAEIARSRPVERAHLRSIPGVGPLKMQRYGDELLRILAAAG